MLQMSGKMWTTPLPAEPLRLENAFLEVRGSPDRIRKAHSVCFSFLFLPCLAAVTPPCPPQTRVPYLPSHLRLPIALLCLTPGRPFTNSFCQLHLFETLESYQREAWLRLPTAGAGSSLPGPCQALPLRRSPGQAWSGLGRSHSHHLPRSASHRQVVPFRGSTACTATALWHPPAFTKRQRSQNSDTCYRVSLHSFGEKS